MSDEDTITALVTAVHTTDAGRRVGWAKAYAAETAKDDLSRDVNILRSERDTMRRAASFLRGFLQGYIERRGDPDLAARTINQWAAHADAILDPDVAKAGAEAAHRIVAVNETERSRRAAQKKQKQRSSQRLFEQARQQERRKLMERYGIPNEAALLNYLEQYPGGAS